MATSQLVILITLLCQLTIISTNDQSNVAVEDSMSTILDNILLDLTTKYDTIKTDDFWHPYDFGTGNDNREVINVVGIVEHQIPGEFIQWKKVQLGLKQHVVGLTANSIEIYDSKLQQTLVKDDMPLTLKTMEVFTSWDTDNLTPFMVIAAVTSAPSILMFTSSGHDTLKEVGSFHLPFSVKTVSLCSAESSKKLMLLPEDNDMPISVYNVEVSQEESQFWFFQRIAKSGFDSAIVHKPDTEDSMLLISKEKELSVYNFDSSLGQFTLHQTMPLQQGCSSMLPFQMMYQHYVSCMASEQDSKSAQFIGYNFNMNEYEESVLNGVAASEMFPVAIGGSRGDMIFVTRETSADQSINTMIYDGQSEFKPGGVACSSEKCAKLETLSNGASFDMEDSSAVVLPTAPQEATATVLTFMTEVSPMASPVAQQSLGIFDEFKVLSSELTKWRTSVAQAENVYDRSLNTQGDNVITGSWEVKTVITEDADVDGREGRAATSDSVFNMLKFGDVHWTEEDFAATNQEISSNMEIMKSNILFISNEKEDALLKNHPGVQLIKSPLTMEGLMFAEHAEAHSMNVQTIMDQDPNEFFMSLANIQDSNVKVKGGLTFPESITATNVETRQLNNLLVDNIAVLSGDNVFDCPYTFEAVNALRDISVEETNGHNLVNSVVMVNDISDFNFLDGIVAYMGAESLESTPFEDLLLSSVDQDVEAPFVFHSVEVQAPMSVGNINGESFKMFRDQIILNNHQEKIKGRKKFTGSVKLNKLFIENQWNGLAFPTDFPTVSNDLLVLSGEKSFSKMVVNQMSVQDTINGINTQDLVSLTEAQILENVQWIFTGETKIAENMAVENTVDGVVMESLLHQGILDSNNLMFNPNADIMFRQPVHIEDLSVASTINDKTFEEIFGDLIMFEGTQCQVPGTTTIKEMASFGDLTLPEDKINGFTVKNFLTRDTVQTISSPVVMTENVSFEELNALAHFDKVLVQDVLDRAMRATATNAKGTVVAWPVHFDSIKCQNVLEVEGPINDLAAYSQSVAVTKGKPNQIINGPIETQNPVFSDLATKSLELQPGRTLQTLDINQWEQSRAKLSEPAKFSQPFSASRVTFQNNLETDSINEIDVNDLKTIVFRKNGKSQTFSGPITFLDGLSVHNGEMRFHKTVDGFELDDYVSHGFPLKARNNEPILIANEWQFESLKLAQGIQLNTNKVCGVDLDALKLDSVKKDETNVLVSGGKSFSQALQVTQGLTSPQMNGKQMEKVFLLHEPQEVEEHPTFGNDVFKDGLSVDSVNNIEMAWLAEKFAVIDGQHVLDHDAFIKNLRTDSLRVLGQIQGRDFESFLANTVKLSDTNMEFMDEVEFVNPISVENAINTEHYNGINVDKLAKQVVMLDQDVTLTQPVSFTNTISGENVIVKGDLKTLSLTNGVNWDDLKTKSIKLDQAGNQINFRNVKFENLVAAQPIQATKMNGRSFDEFVTLNTEQYLGNLQFSQVSLQSSVVDVKGNFGGRKISDEFQDTLMKNTQEPQRVTGTTVIKGPVHIKKDFSCFGSEFQKDIVTPNDVLELDSVEFTSPMVVENDVILTESIDGHTVESLFSGAFMTESAEGRQQVISDKWEFLGPVIFRNEVLGKTVSDSVNIEALVQNKHDDLKRAQKKVDAERGSFLRKCKALHEIRNTIAKNPVKLDSFDSHQVITLKNEGKNALAVNHNDGVMLLVQTANCKLDRYEWQSSTDLFHKVVEESPVNLGGIDSWQSAPLAEGGSVIVFSKSISSCSQDAGLFSVTVTPNGDLTPVLGIRSDFPVKSFKLVTKPDTGETRLFNLVDSINPGVEVFTFTEDGFSFQEFVHLDAPMDRVDVTSSSRGFGLMCHNDNLVTMYDISNDHSEDVSASGAMLASTKGSMAVFENFDTLYALLPESGTSSASLIQPTCNFQVMRLNGGLIESVQKMQVPEVVSSVMFSLPNKNFVSFLSKSHGLSVYKFMGLNGFQPVGKPYRVFGGFMLKAFSVKTSALDRTEPFMMVLSKNTVEIFRGNVFGDSLNTDFEPLCSSA